MVLILNINLIFAIINLSLIIILILTLIILTRNPENIKIGREYNSQNLFLKLSSHPKNKISENNIFLFSHLDSKGQAFSIKVRIQIYYIWIISFSISLLIILINLFFFLSVGK